MKADTLWVKRVHTYINGRCFWAMEIAFDASWTVRKVLSSSEVGPHAIQSWEWKVHIFWGEDI